MQEESISIINRTNGQLTGERAQSIPVKLIASFSWLKIFLAGATIMFVVVFFLLQTAMNEVVQVDVSGKTEEFEILKIK